jgi:hypothetical protein
LAVEGSTCTGSERICGIECSDVAAVKDPLVWLLDQEHPAEAGQRLVVGVDAQDIAPPTISSLTRSSGLVFLSLKSRTIMSAAVAGSITGPRRELHHF